MNEICGDSVVMYVCGSNFFGQIDAACHQEVSKSVSLPTKVLDFMKTPLKAGASKNSSAIGPPYDICATWDRIVCCCGVSFFVLCTYCHFTFDDSRVWGKTLCDGEKRIRENWTRKHFCCTLFQEKVCTSRALVRKWQANLPSVDWPAMLNVPALSPGHVSHWKRFLQSFLLLHRNASQQSLAEIFSFRWIGNTQSPGPESNGTPNGKTSKSEMYWLHWKQSSGCHRLETYSSVIFALYCCSCHRKQRIFSASFHRWWRKFSLGVGHQRCEVAFQSTWVSVTHSSGVVWQGARTLLVDLGNSFVLRSWKVCWIQYHVLFHSRIAWQFFFFFFSCLLLQSRTVRTRHNRGMLESHSHRSSEWSQYVGYCCWRVAFRRR